MARVLLFGRLADQAGWRQCEIDAGDLSALRAAIAFADPALGEALLAPGVQVAVDKMIVREDTALSPAAEVAFLPPMSGG